MRLRSATAADAAAMAEINVEAGRAAWAEHLPVDRLEPREDRYEQRLVEAVDAFIAEDGDAPVGFVVARESQDPDGRGVGEIDTLYTLPEVWGSGVGRALLDAGLATLRAAGFAEATLWTADFNRRARNVYEHYGWRLDGAAREKSFVGTSFTELRYRIEL